MIERASQYASLENQAKCAPLLLLCHKARSPMSRWSQKPLSVHRKPGTTSIKLCRDDSWRISQIYVLEPFLYLNRPITASRPIPLLKPLLPVTTTRTIIILAAERCHRDRQNLPQ
jgi:hypothetical protein